MDISSSVNLALSDFVDEVAERTGEDPSAVRTYVDPFVDEGVITDEAIEQSVTDVAQILATAETRVDLATRKRAEVRTAVTAAPDLAIVGVRDRAFRDRLADLRADVEDLGRTLTSVRTGIDSPVAVYQAGADLHDLTTDAQRIVRVSHDLETELGAFEAWLSSAPRRHDAIVDEIDAAESSAAAVTESIDTLLTSNQHDAERWFDARVQTLVLGVVIDDLRAEMADLREWAAREQRSFPTKVEERIESLGEVAAACARDLEESPREETAHDDRLEKLRKQLAEVDPPVAWARVDAQVAAAREAIDADEQD